MEDTVPGIATPPAIGSSRALARGLDCAIALWPKAFMGWRPPKHFGNCLLSGRMVSDRQGTECEQIAPPLSPRPWQDVLPSRTLKKKVKARSLRCLALIDGQEIQVWYFLFEMRMRGVRLRMRWTLLPGRDGFIRHIRLMGREGRVK
jgi:hypothetical protein